MTYDNYLEFVDAREKNPPELSVLGGLKADVPALDLEGSLLQRVVVLVQDKAVDAPVGFGQELDQRLYVGLS
jgi:hypothetical protein